MPSEDQAPVNNAWFKSRMADRGLSQRGTAKLLGLDPGALSLMLRGKRTMRMHEAIDMARLLGVPLQELMVQFGVERREMAAQEIAVSGWLDPHGEVHFEPELGTVDRPHGLPVDATAIQCRTSGSDIDYMDGWLMFVERPAEPPLPDHLGRLCLVRINAGVIYLAQLRRGYAPSRWNLAGPVAHAQDVALDWSAPVLSIKT